MNNNIHLSNLISIGLNKMYNFDIPTSMTISTLVISLIGMVEFSMYYLFLFIPAGFYYYFKFYSKRKTDTYTISIHDPNLISNILWYIQEYPNFFDKKYDIQFGNKEYISDWDIDDIFIPENDSQININDTLFGISGYITVKLFNYTHSYDKEGKPQKRYRIYFEFNLKYNDKSNYIEFIEKHKKEKTTIYYTYGIKYFPKQGEYCGVHILNTLLFKGTRLTDKERYQKYISSYFSPIKNELWKRIEKVHNNPESILKLGQIPSFNLLAYGPPGSGKSTFAYRIAMALNRHLVSIDLSTCCELPIENIFTIINKPPTSIVTSFEAKECVIVFEEFDRAIFRLNEKQKKREKLLEYYLNTDKSEMKEEKIESKKEFDLGDLLELLQGPIPNSGSIIIATTNHYEKIKEILPALFRPGRLTPVKFDYLDFNTLQELSLFYFQKELTIPKIDTINIPTSKIIDLAITYNLENNFDGFQKELNGLVSTHLKEKG